MPLCRVDGTKTAQIPDPPKFAFALQNRGFKHKSIPQDWHKAEKEFRRESSPPSEQTGIARLYRHGYFDKRWQVGEWIQSRYCGNFVPNEIDWNEQFKH